MGQYLVVAYRSSRIACAGYTSVRPDVRVTMYRRRMLGACVLTACSRRHCDTIEQIVHVYKREWTGRYRCSYTSALT